MCNLELGTFYIFSGNSLSAFQVNLYTNPVVLVGVCPLRVSYAAYYRIISGLDASKAFRIYIF